MSLDSWMNEYLAENTPRFNVRKSLSRFSPKKAMATASVLTALLAGAYSLKTDADTIIPLIEPSTSIQLTNTTNKEIKGNVYFSQIQPNGTGVGDVPYTLAPGETKEIENQLTDSNLTRCPWVSVTPSMNGSSKYSDPAVSVQTCDNTNGYVPSLWKPAVCDNTKTLAGTLTDGLEYVIIFAGAGGANLKFTAHGPENIGGPMIATLTVAAGNRRLINVNGIFDAVPPPGGSLEMEVVSGSATAGLRYTDEASQTHRWQDLREVTTVQKPADIAAKEYVAKWLPPSNSVFYLNNTEIRAMINGETGVSSYVDDLATELYKDPVMQGEFNDVSEMAQWFKDRADGVPGNSEFCPNFDPFTWNATVGVRVYDGLACGPIDFKPGESPMQTVYGIFKNQFLWQHVMMNPQLYGGSAGGVPDVSFNPSWTSQDPN